MMRMAIIAAASVAWVGCATAPVAVPCPDGTEAVWTRPVDPWPIDTVSCRKPDGTPHGPFVIWAEGYLWKAGNYEDGSLQGAAFEWLDDGRRGVISDFEAGKLRNATRWNNAGVATFEQVSTGETAVTTMRYEGGAIKARIEWRDDEPDGAFETWYESGQRHLKGALHRSRRVGAWTCWSEQGGPMRVEFDAAGDLIGLSAEDTDAWWQCSRGVAFDASVPEQVPAAIE